jgi:CHAT domain-containing protein/Tfp pilus assembly protein PilF
MWHQLTSGVCYLTAALALVLTTVASHTVFTQDQAPLRGVVVEEVGAGSAGEKAGIEPGDVLLSWVRAAAPPANPDETGGDIGSPFDVADIELEQAPRAAVTLRISRSGANLSVTVPPGAWAIAVRPAFGEVLLSRYRQGRDLLAKETDQAAGVWRDLAVQAHNANDRELAAWLLFRVGDALAAARRWDEAHAAYQAAIAAVKDDGNGLARVAGIWDAEGTAFERQNDLLRAETAHREALRIREMNSGAGLAIAASLTRLGTIAVARSDLVAAEESFKRSLAIREKLAPASLGVAADLSNLARVAAERDDLGTAEELLRRSLAVSEKLAPDGLEVAGRLNSLGVVAYNRGDLATSEVFYRRSLAIREKQAPDSLEVASSLNNIGVVAKERGDFAAAEEFYRRSMAIREKRIPGSPEVAQSLNNLGILAKDRGDLATAEELHRRSLAVLLKQAPESLVVAQSLNNLGLVTQARGDLAGAEEFFRRSLRINEKSSSENLGVATSLNNLGEVAETRGDLPAAEELYNRSLAILQKLAPDGLLVAASLYNLGNVANKRGDRSAAEHSYTASLTLWQKLAPGSGAEAQTLYSLGLLTRAAKRHEAAAGYLRSALTAIEAQAGRLGGAEEVRAGFTAQYADYYRDYVDLLLEINQPAQAFDILERSRARSLLAMLAERDLVFAADLPSDLARQRTLLNADYDRTQAALARLNPGKDAAEIDRLLARVRELRDQREAMAQAIRKTSPRYASLVYPQPLDLAGARRSLDAGTVLLAYTVGKEKTFLLVVQPERPVVGGTPPVSVYAVPIGEAALREKVTAFRSLIQRGAQSSVATEALVTAGQELFSALIEPARNLIAASDRVLISPDGPLHTLPFAALVQQTDRASVPRYLIEWKPLHVVASATVYAELKRTRRNPGAAPAPVELAAFGDPSYPPLSAAEVERIANPEVRAAVRRGYALEPLPATRKEVEGIAQLYGSRAATYLGDQATEERAKAIGTSARYLHFASHGLLDERFPLNSALALTIPERPADGQANGLLQAWEIFEQIRIDADLVTLSACETGLGKELGGEGLVGLTRAFQYAGARTVLASLWSVGDESTAALMTRVYGHLKAGRTKDQSLRAAQLEMIRTRGFSHPFQWAAFQLAGDWQ